MKKIKTKIWGSIFTLIIIIFSSVTLITNNKNKYLLEQDTFLNPYNIDINGLITSDIINIDNTNPAKSWSYYRDNFNWCNGTGSEIDPFIIGGITIDGGGSSYCISIQNSQVYFKIESSLLQNSQDGIDLFNVKNGTIINNDILNTNRRGIYLRESHFIQILSNNLIDNGQEAVYLEDSHNNLIIESYINGMTSIGLCLQYSARNTLSNNVIYKIEGNGIYLKESNSNLITQNSISRSLLSNGWGIYISGYHSNEITNNNVSNNGGGGIFLFGVNNSIFTNNHADDNTKTGINIYQSTGIICKQNSANRNGEYGIKNSGQYTQIQNCTASDNILDGIYITEGSAIINECTTNDNSQNGIYFRDNQYCSIQDTLSKDNLEAGIKISNNVNEFFMNNNELQGNEIGIHISEINPSEVKPQISDNLISSNNQEGINVLNSQEIIISNNIFESNFKDGLKIQNSQYLTIDDNYYNLNNENGVNLINSKYINISNNDYEKNSIIGLNLDISCSNINVYGNYFNTNGQNAVDNGTSNNWDNGTRGNFWDDYVGFDLDDDGFGDTAYTILGTASSIDNFPICNDGPDLIELINPKNIIYYEANAGPIEGVYKASLGFEDIDDGDLPIGWDKIEGVWYHNEEVKVIPEKWNHKKVLQFYNYVDRGAARIRAQIEQHSTGEIEFWWATETPNKRLYLQLRHPTENWYGPYILLADNYFNYWQDRIWNGEEMIGYKPVLPAQAGIWYHHRIVFNCEAKEWDWYINDNLVKGGIKFTDDNRDFPSLGILEMQTRGGYDGYGRNYFDAFGYSWDTSYEMGDNKDVILQGLALDFFPDNLQSMEYVLDSQNPVSVSVDSFIPYPEAGTHSIQLFGYDPIGGDYISDIVHFAVADESPSFDGIFLCQPEDRIYPILNDEEFVEIPLQIISDNTLISRFYSLNGGPNIEFVGDSLIILPALKDSYSIQIFGEDMLGNSYSSEIRQFSVDYYLKILDLNNIYKINEVSEVNLSFTSSSEDFILMSYELDGVPFEISTNQISFPTPEVGLHSIQIFASDSEGIEHQSEKHYFEILEQYTVYTPSGINIEIQDPETNIQLTYDEITIEGNTIIEIRDNGPELPHGFLLNGDYYDISTTADFKPPIIIGIPYDESDVIGDESTIRLYHYEDLTGWTDITTTIDTVNNIIYGEAYSFSNFAAVESDTTPPEIIIEYKGGDKNDANPGSWDVSAFDDVSGINEENINIYIDDVMVGSQFGEYYVPNVLGEHIIRVSVVNNHPLKPLESIRSISLTIEDDDILPPEITIDYYGSGTDGDPGYFAWEIYDSDSEINDLSLNVRYKSLDGVYDNVIKLPSNQSGFWNLPIELGTYTLTIYAQDDDSDSTLIVDSLKTELTIEQELVDDDDIAPELSDLQIQYDDLKINLTFNVFDESGIGDILILINGEIATPSICTQNGKLYTLIFDNEWYQSNNNIVEIIVYDADSDYPNDTLSSIICGEFGEDSGNEDGGGIPGFDIYIVLGSFLGISLILMWLHKKRTRPIT